MSGPAVHGYPRWLGRRYLFSVAGRRIPSYPVMLYVGCVLGVLAGAGVSGAAGLEPTRVALATIAMLVPALVGARLLFVVQHLELFRADPRRIWRRSEGGAALYGGLVLSIPVSVPLLAVCDLPFWKFWDAASVTMLVGLVVTRLGCLMHGCCSGRATTSRLGMWLPNHSGVWLRRYPTPLLEAGWGVSVLAGALAARGHIPFPGGLFACVVAAYAGGRLLLEPTREAQPATPARSANLALSAVLLAAAIGVLVSGWIQSV